MKLAEALQERADLNRNIEQLRFRLTTNALVQEGEETAEDPKKLKKELDASLERLGVLMAAINHTNCAAKIDGVSLTEMIAKKDVLTLKLSCYRDLAHAASGAVQRARSSEIRILPAVSASEIQKQIDAAAKELRKLDNKLQESNWLTELIEP